jgi:hypothetical protein
LTEVQKGLKTALFAFSKAQVLYKHICPLYNGHYKRHTKSKGQTVKDKEAKDIQISKKT